MPLKTFSGQLLKVWLPLTVFFVSALLVLFLLASGKWKGMADNNVKTVTVTMAPGAEKASLRVSFEPPIAVMEVDGASQLLEAQFANYSKQPITVDPDTLSVERDSCFSLAPAPASAFVLRSMGTRVTYYRLSVSEEGKRSFDIPEGTRRSLQNFNLEELERGRTDDCSGRHTLSLSYKYRAPNKKAEMLTQTRGITTGPILITTHSKVIRERFFHTAGAIAIPILLAMATFLIQQFQSHKAELAKEQELKLQVWQTIFPMIDGYFRRYYVPLYLRMEKLQDSIRKTPRSVENELTDLMVMTRLYDQLGKKIGGYYFRTRGGENVCSRLTEMLRKEIDTLAVDADMLATVTESLDPGDTRPIAKRKLNALGRGDPATAQFLAKLEVALIQPGKLDTILLLLGHIIEVMDFENNFLWYPEWYEGVPVLNLGALEKGDFGFTTQQQKRWKVMIREYRRELPSKCVS